MAAGLLIRDEASNAVSEYKLKEITMSDPMVLATQQWLNKTYKGKAGYTSIKENGETGWDTIYALLQALQIELGIYSYGR